MESHKFHVGQTVQFVKPPQSSSIDGIGPMPAGSFRVAGLLPGYLGNNLSKVKSPCSE
jgi:hypothetical protein